MREIQYIENQYDNVLKPMKWDEKTARRFMHVIKHPLIVEKKDMIPQWKFCTVYGETRMTENIGLTDVMILDFDDKDYSIKEFEDAFRPYNYILHTSHSYDGLNQKFRVFLFLDREYDIQRLFFKGSNKAFSPYHYLIKYFPHADKASFVRAQFFKMPALKYKDAPYYYKVNKGAPFNPFKELGFEYKLAYDECVEKQDEYLAKRKKESEMKRRMNGNNDLGNAVKYIADKIENAREGERHNAIFSAAAWFKKIGGTYAEFSEIEPTWADRAYRKQMNRLANEWDRIR